MTSRHLSAQHWIDVLAPQVLGPRDLETLNAQLRRVQDSLDRLAGTRDVAETQLFLSTLTVDIEQLVWFVGTVAPYTSITNVAVPPKDKTQDLALLPTVGAYAQLFDDLARARPGTAAELQPTAESAGLLDVLKAFHKGIGFVLFGVGAVIARSYNRITGIGQQTQMQLGPVSVVEVAQIQGQASIGRALDATIDELGDALAERDRTKKRLNRLRDRAFATTDASAMVAVRNDLTQQCLQFSTQVAKIEQLNFQKMSLRNLQHSNSPAAITAGMRIVLHSEMSPDVDAQECKARFEEDVPASELPVVSQSELLQSMAMCVSVIGFIQAEDPVMSALKQCTSQLETAFDDTTWPQLAQTAFRSLSSAPQMLQIAAPDVITAEPSWTWAFVAREAQDAVQSILWCIPQALAALKDRETEQQVACSARADAARAASPDRDEKHREYEHKQATHGVRPRDTMRELVAYGASILRRLSFLLQFPWDLVHGFVLFYKTYHEPLLESSSDIVIMAELVAVVATVMIARKKGRVPQWLLPAYQVGAAISGQSLRLGVFTLAGFEMFFAAMRQRHAPVRRTDQKNVHREPAFHTDAKSIKELASARTFSPVLIPSVSNAASSSLRRHDWRSLDLQLIGVAASDGFRFVPVVPPHEDPVFLMVHRDDRDRKLSNVRSELFDGGEFYFLLPRGSGIIPLQVDWQCLPSPSLSVDRQCLPSPSLSV